MSSSPRAGASESEVIARAPGVTGGELVLRRVGEHFEIISNGVFLMDTRGGASEREMVRAALAALPAGRTGIRVLIGGLGVGFSAREALDDERVEHVRVVELEPRVIEWHSGPLAEVAGRLPEDPRCELTRADFLSWLGAATETFDAICVDIDNGPDWTVVEGNDRLYEPPALERLGRILSPEGVIAFWSAMRAPGFAARLEERSSAVRTIEIPAPRGEPDIVYLARP
ncbi:spermine/spermidine synthase domain-containing protein [Allosalinactinospora lopnorensis]|uniref:spermine/spermidine synthase domain-containing protein n=1 Tax=Allosalinactinospora lopnorensis TaxID=1352348 RepID=UPI000623E42B|nr:spermidine synthase [Allosalinactinospora lopnorensis]